VKPLELPDPRVAHVTLIHAEIDPEPGVRLIVSFVASSGRGGLDSRLVRFGPGHYDVPERSEPLRAAHTSMTELMSAASMSARTQGIVATSAVSLVPRQAPPADPEPGFVALRRRFSFSLAPLPTYVAPGRDAGSD